MLDGKGINYMLRQSANTEAERIFKVKMSRYGTVWRLPDPNSHDALGLEELRAIFRINIAMQTRAIGPRGFIHFDYLDNPSFNALAWTHSLYDFVALFSGTIFYLYRLFYCYMSDPEVLPSLGDLSKEALNEDVLDAIRGKNKNSFAFQHPCDDTRYKAAQNLALVSCLLILNHEIGHLANCHPYLFQQRFGLDVYEELPMPSTEDKHNRLRRAFEWEADEYAGVVTYQITNKIHGLLAGVEGLSMDYVLSVSAFMLFLYIHRQTGSRFDAESLTHPAPRDRWVWMNHEIEHHDRCKRLQPNHDEILQGIQDVAAFWSRNKLVDKTEVEPSPNWTGDLQRRFDGARQVLREYNDELKELEAQRSERGRLWRDLNRAEADAFSRGAFAHLSKGVVTRPRPVD
jgi:hypothetical protein